MEFIPRSRIPFSEDNLFTIDDRIIERSNRAGQSNQLPPMQSGVRPVRDIGPDLVKSGTPLLKSLPINRTLEDQQYLMNQRMITEILLKSLSTTQVPDAYDNLNEELRSDDKRALEDTEQYRRAINSISTAWNSLGVFRSDFIKNDNDKMCRNAYVAIVEKAFLDYFGSLEWDIMDKDTGDRADRPYDFLSQPNPQESFSDILVPATRDLFRYDAGCWVKTLNRKMELLELKAYLGTEFWIEMDRVPQIISVPAADNFTGIRATNYAGDKGTGREVMMQGWWSRGYTWRFWQRSLTGVYIPYTPSEICYFVRYKRSDNIYGTDYLKYLKYQVQYLIDSTVAAGKTFQNGLVPSMIITHPQVYAIEQIQQRIMQLRTDNTGAVRFGAPMHLINGEDAKSFAQHLHDMEWVEGQKFIAQLIWGYFGFAPDEFVGGDINRACYSEDTEVLTENGWKLHKNIPSNEKITVYDPKTKTCHLEIPSSLHTYFADEDLVRFKTNAQDILVTKEHTILRAGTHWKPDSDWKISKAKEVIGKRIAVKAGTESWIGQSQEISDDYLSFLGWAISEGGLSSTCRAKKVYVMTLAQSNAKPENVMEIKRILKSLGLRSEGYQNKTDNTTRWNVAGKRIIEPLFDSIGAYCTEKRIPRKYLNLPKKKLQKIFDALMAGDGTWDKRENRICGSYSTTSSQLADDFQELAFKLGYGTKRTISYLEHGNRATGYRILIQKKIVREIISPKLERYVGNVYCFSTSTGFYVTRRNGCIAVQGNTSYVKRNITKSRLLYPMMRYFEDKINREILPWLKGYKKDWRFKFIRELELDDSQKKAQTGAIRMGTIGAAFAQGIPIRVALKIADDERLNAQDIRQLEEARESFIMQQNGSGELGGEGGDGFLEDSEQGRYGTGSEMYQPMNFSDYGQGGEGTEQRFGNKEEIEYEKARVYEKGMTFRKDGVLHEVTFANDKIVKAKVYVSSPEQVPEGRSYKQGDRGGTYYLTTLKQQERAPTKKKRKGGSGGSGGGEEENGSDEHSAPPPPDLKGADKQVKVTGNGVGIVAGIVGGKLKVLKKENEETDQFVRKVVSCGNGEKTPEKFITCLKKIAKDDGLQISS